MLDQSNADAIAEAMEPFTDGDDPDVVMESHDHWAVGHVDGFTIRVYRDGEITEAFKHLPRPDGADWTATRSSTKRITPAGSMRRPSKTSVTPPGGSSTNTTLPDGWEGDVYSWLRDNRQRAVENRDDQGGYPEEDDLRDSLRRPGTMSGVEGARATRLDTPRRV